MTDETKKEIQETAQKIFNDFQQFADGYHVLFLIHRNKEGGSTNNTKLRKLVSRNSEEYLKHLTTLLIEDYESDLPLRIYESVNERNFDKAIRQFKHEQLDADDYDQIQKENFYLDVKNRFIGCMMQPAQQATSYFLFDVDTNDYDIVQDLRKQLDSCDSEQGAISHLRIKEYKTKNGWHIVTTPFNHTTLKMPQNVSFNKDGLLLLSFAVL